jgi:hypothetical protein
MSMTPWELIQFLAQFDSDKPIVFYYEAPDGQEKELYIDKVTAAQVNNKIAIECREA